ncbi:hypothetical protein IDH44_02030 [Paenibacillus sp. IB182496]|uniref:LamG-like jellyroll fold domain-containing protein n=1 Tax=Paenibacillus sabuli TaxID=2772509 RepID=A0A927BNT4_9BACL|nr:sugar-binding protein [Paenibacillus sabuli]MBD2843958.1 hypothetical protein [Paenibacillus sabuli]
MKHCARLATPMTVLLVLTMALFAVWGGAKPLPTAHATAAEPIGYWSLDESSGTEAASDGAGSGLDGTLMNRPAHVEGVLGNAVFFDGRNDYIDLGNPAALQLSGAMSVTAWVYADDFDTNGRIISKENGPGSQGWSLYAGADGKGRFQIATGADTTVPVETASALPAGQWVHLAGVYEPGTALRIYVNGVLDQAVTADVPTAQVVNGNAVFIGRQPDFSSPFAGKLDELYVFDQALTTAEVEALATLPSVPPVVSSPVPGPVASPTPTAPAAEFVPSFEAISVYMPGAGADSEIGLQYREAGASVWQTAFPPVYDERTNQFRGSIVKLNEDTSYEVKATVSLDGATVACETAAVDTWTSSPTIAQTISLASLYTGGALELDGLTGTENGWIKVVNDTGIVIDGAKLATAAVTVTDSQYVILEDFVVRGGIRHGIQIGGTNSDIRIANADITGWGREVVETTETGTLGYPVDADGAEINNDAGIAIYDGRNIVVERSYVYEPNGWSNTWKGVTMGGLAYSSTHPKGPNAVFLRGRGGIVLRYNDFAASDAHRFNDVVETYENGQESGGPYRDADIYGNFLGYGNDDATELDGGQMNVRFYNNRNEQTFGGISIVPNLLGPSYVYNNLSANMGDATRSTGGAIVKGGGNANLGVGWSFLFNNTYYTDGNGFASYRYSNQRAMRAYTRNNIIVLDRALPTGFYNIRDDYQRQENSFDYDALGTTSRTDGVGRILAYPGNEANAQWGIAAMTDPAAGLFTLEPSAGTGEVNVIDQGVVVPNFTDGYAGGAPDIGAIEYGESGLMPKRPIPLTADRYFVAIPDDADTAQFTISPGSYSGAYAIRKAPSDDWYTVTPSSGTFTAGVDTTFTITLDKSKAAFDKAEEYSTLFVRLPSGHSVPVSVIAYNADPDPVTPPATPDPEPEPEVSTEPEIGIPATAAAPTIDGAADSVWTQSDPAALTQVTRGTIDSAADLSASWQALWDADALYVLVDVADDVRVNDSGSVWDDDSVEVYIDADNSKEAAYDQVNDLQYQFGYGDTTPIETKLNRIAGVQYAVQDTTVGYRMEIKLPWTTLGLIPAAGSVIGLEIAVNDDDDGDLRDGKLQWKAEEDTSWKDPRVFGNAELEEAAE